MLLKGHKRFPEVLYDIFQHHRLPRFILAATHFGDGALELQFLIINIRSSWIRSDILELGHSLGFRRNQLEDGGCLIEIAVAVQPGHIRYHNLRRIPQ